MLDQPREELTRYFDETLTDLILADRACAKESSQICNLDFSPMWDSQDPDAADLAVATTDDPALVSVSYTYPATGQPVSMTYEMAQTGSGWRIQDIRYQSGATLVGLLRGSQ